MAWLLSTGALLYSFHGSWAIIPAVFTGVLLLMLVRGGGYTVESVNLTLYPDGRATWTDHGQQAMEGLVGRTSWSAGRYAVVRVDTSKRPQNFLVSLGNQEPGVYCALLGWLVLGFPIQELQEHGEWQKNIK